MASALGRQFSVGDGEVEDWISSYNAVMSRGGGGAEGAAKKGGPGCCSICCTGFSIFAALFLFVLAALMKGHYPYLHVHGASHGRGWVGGWGLGWSSRQLLGRTGWGADALVQAPTLHTRVAPTPRLPAIACGPTSLRCAPLLGSLPLLRVIICAAPHTLVPSRCCWPTLRLTPPRTSRAGDMGLMSKNVMYAGLVYLAFALVAMTFWVKGVLLLRADGGSGFQRVG